MKLTIGNYEVEIKAKYKYSEKYNKKDTYRLLNTITSWGGAYWLYWHGHGINDKMAKEESDSIYKFLDSKGYYDDVKEKGEIK